MTKPRPLRVAIIGAGPAGFYTAEGLLKQLEHLSIDLFDRLPTPYGLVRYGVAPDHQVIKSVTKMFERTATNSRLRFFGNVRFGRDISHEDIKQHYDAVVYTVGASSDRSLGIPGESLEGNLSATEFVAWYNGHPDYQQHIQAITAKAVAVIGVGNVAVDVARILAKSAAELAQTDIADQALEVLAQSPVEDIYVLGRRGAAQAKFTTKELRELGSLQNADIVVRTEELAADAASLASIATDTIAQANLKVLRELAEQPLSGKPRRIHLRFLVSPVEILGEAQVEVIRLEGNRLRSTGSGYINAVGTGEFETLPVQMVLRSVGYRGTALPGVPFDSRKGVIPNDRGVVLDNEGQVLQGEFVAGWIKRGPTGVIGTNKADALETVAQLIEQQGQQHLSADESKSEKAIVNFLQRRGVQYVTFEQWLELDKHERSAGQALGRPRKKVTALEDMLELCRPVSV